MRDSNFTVSFMHGDMPQKERDAVMAGFRSRATRLMITTDVWARGIDVEQGVVVNFVKDNEIQILRDIEQNYGTNIRECLEDPTDII